MKCKEKLGGKKGDRKDILSDEIKFRGNIDDEAKSKNEREGNELMFAAIKLYFLNVTNRIIIRHNRKHHKNVRFDGSYTASLKTMVIRINKPTPL